MRRLMMLGATGLLVAACGGLGVPGFTIPPINLSSFPPFELPSGGIPLPSGLTGTVPCALVTAAEVQSIFGTSVTDTSTDGLDCGFLMSNLQTMVVTTESGTDLNSSRGLFGSTAKDLTVAGLPAVSGLVIIVNQPAVHVQRGSDQLQVQGFLMGTDDATIAKLAQVAGIAVTRWP